MNHESTQIIQQKTLFMFKSCRMSSMLGTMTQQKVIMVNDVMKYDWDNQYVVRSMEQPTIIPSIPDH